jgi:hypothetical protein
MATNATRTQQTKSGTAAPPVTLPQEAGVRHRPSPNSPVEGQARPVGYGLPCAKCRLYYAADLDACPTCHHQERVSAAVPKIPPKVVQAAEPVPNTEVVEHERDEFLRQFKSQLLDAHAQVANVAESVCTLGPHPTGELLQAEVCKACYERVQERLDVYEAALHIDLKEAAQLIYDAVWADPSDPNKTYQNAANALLAELRKRAGMNSLLGPFHQLPD